jgi:hypothetical protein
MKKVLSIDGGGIRGVFPVSFLANVEETIGHNIGDYFDLIVGTSTGGIIALALGLGFSAREILTFYEDLGDSVFRGNRLLGLLRRIGFAKYSSGPLRAALQLKFGQSLLGNSRRRLVVPSLNLLTGEVHIYKTAHHPRLATDYRVPMVDVALATSAAPTYFPTHKSATGLPLIDGGVWANNPAGLAAVEALSMLGWNKGEFKILSLGCTCAALDVAPSTVLGWGLAPWALRIVDVIMTAQSSSSLGTAQHLAGHENVIRVNPMMPAGRFGLDVVSEMTTLRALGESEARTALPTLTGLFLAPADVFEPYHRLG